MRLIFKVTFFLFFLTVGVAAKPYDIKNIIWMTEDCPPFNYMEKGKLKGISVEIVNNIFKNVGFKEIDIKIEVLPWARSYHKVKQEDNYALFSTTHSKSRHPLFKWVGPLAPIRVVIFARKDKKIVIDNVKDLLKYSIGVVKDDIGELLLKDQGIKGKKLSG